jgi:calcineurin-like phosphoesterase family protein
MTTWFTSDLHLGHANIIKYCNRPFSSVDEMNETLIANWNARVKPDEIVYHVGDFAFGCTKEHVSQFIYRLNGRKFFIRGNHEHLLDAVFGAPLIKDYLEVGVDGQKIVLFHYGLRTWHHDLRGTWHLFGHSHTGLPPLGKSCDVGVDAWNYAPVSFEELKVFMDARPVHKAPEFARFEGS